MKENNQRIDRRKFFRRGAKAVPFLAITSVSNVASRANIIPTETASTISTAALGVTIAAINGERNVGKLAAWGIGFGTIAASLGEAIKHVEVSVKIK